MAILGVDDFKAKLRGQGVVALRGAIVDESQKTWLAESKDASCMQANRAKGAHKGIPMTKAPWIPVLGRFACNFSRKWYAGPFFGARAGAGAPAYKPSSVLSP